jgi:hypothetical protein
MNANKTTFLGHDIKLSTFYSEKQEVELEKGFEPSAY